MAHWSAAQYERFSDLRTRPFEDLLSRVGAREPSLVVDLGCGNGVATLLLAQRWPQARVVGVDSSSDMLSRAAEHDTEGRVEWVRGRVEDWDPAQYGGAPDVLVSNATLQWVPTHRELVERWLRAMPAGGWFAMQVPGNFQAPSHRIIREVAAAQPEGARLAGLLRADPVLEPRGYAGLLAPVADHVDVWETTYLQLLDPDAAQRDPVLEWVQGTALRPLLEALDEPGRARLLDDLTGPLQEAYPREAYGVPFPFRRIFAVARVGDAT